NAPRKGTKRAERLHTAAHRQIREGVTLGAPRDRHRPLRNREKQPDLAGLDLQRVKMSRGEEIRRAADRLGLELPGVRRGAEDDRRREQGGARVPAGGGPGLDLLADRAGALSGACGQTKGGWAMTTKEALRLKAMIGDYPITAALKK